MACPFCKRKATLGPRTATARRRLEEESAALSRDAATGKWEFKHSVRSWLTSRHHEPLHPRARRPPRLRFQAAQSRKRTRTTTRTKGLLPRKWESTVDFETPNRR